LGGVEVRELVSRREHEGVGSANSASDSFVEVDNEVVRCCGELPKYIVLIELELSEPMGVEIHHTLFILVPTEEPVRLGRDNPFRLR